jgi:tetratricopeptide (TPR) repeat protein
MKQVLVTRWIGLINLFAFATCFSACFSLSAQAERLNEMHTGEPLNDDSLILTGDSVIRLQLARGQVLYRLGQYQEALTAVEQVLIRYPESSSAWELKGNILQQLERHSEALNAYDRALLFSEHPQANEPISADNLPNDLPTAVLWTERARVLARLNRNQASVAAYDQALQIYCLYRSAASTTAPECQLYLQQLERANPESFPTSAVDPNSSDSTPLW